MKVVGLIVEYNPFHNGHLFHFQQALKETNADACVAVMSGNFLQRGEPAVVSKWARTKMALSVGIDLVLELPTAYCTQNAEMFAFGAVSALDSLGMVDFLCFGSESGDIAWIKELADRLADEPLEFKHELKSLLKDGLPYPKAYAKAASTLVPDAETRLEQPNNILGLNYVLALNRLQSTIEASTITRIKAGYHQADISDSRIASATALRKLIFEHSVDQIKDFVPLSTYEILLEEKAMGRFPLSWKEYFPFVLHSILSKSKAELAQIHEMEEGLENRLKSLQLKAGDFGSFMDLLKTKRYTWNRLQRVMLYLLLNLTKKEMNSFRIKEGIPYLRVLGFNEKGRHLLHQAKARSKVPLISKVAGINHPMLELDIRASHIHSLGYRTQGLEDQSDYHYSPMRWFKEKG